MTASSAETSPTETTAEEVVIIAKHAPAAERISAPGCLLLILLSLLLSSMAHEEIIVIIKEVCEGVAPPKELPENIVCLLETEPATAATSSMASEALEKV